MFPEDDSGKKSTPNHAVLDNNKYIFNNDGSIIDIKNNEMAR